MAENLQPRFTSSAVPTTAFTAEQWEKKKYWTELAIQCSKECIDLYNGETKHPLHKWMMQHRRANTSGRKTAVHLYLKKKKLFLWGQQCKHLGQRRQMVWKRNKGICLCQMERLCLNREGGQRLYLSPTYNTVLSSLPRQLYNHSHLGSARLRIPHESQFDLKPRVNIRVAF